MSSLPNEILSDMTNFLPNDDITDLMLMSKTFNALVTPRLQKIDENLTTVNQSIHDFPTIEKNLKKFEPIGSVAKKRVKDVFERIRNGESKLDLMGLKEKMSLERFDDTTFLLILLAFVASPKFCDECNVSKELAGCITFLSTMRLRGRYFGN